MSIAALRRAARESVSGLPREFWWLWTSTLVNRLGAFVATFMALYLTVDRGYSASYAGLVGRAARARRGRLLARRGCDDRPARAAAHAAGRAGVHGRLRRACSASCSTRWRSPAVAFLVGMASNASRPAVQAMMADIVRPEDRVRAFSLNYWAINLGLRRLRRGAPGFIAEYSYLAGFLGEAGDDADLRDRRLRQAAGVPARAGRRRRTRRRSRDVGLGTVLRDGRFMSVVGAVLPDRADLPCRGTSGCRVAMGAAGFSSADFGMAIAVNGVLIVALQIPVTRFIEHRDPRRLLVISVAARRVRLRAHRLRRVGRRLRADRLRLDAGRDRQRAHPDRARGPALARCTGAAATRACTPCPGRWPRWSPR